MGEKQESPSYLNVVFANARQHTEKHASWGKFVFSALLAAVGMYLQYRAGLRTLWAAMKFFGCAVLAYPLVWLTVFLWNLALAPRRVYGAKLKEIDDLNAKISDLKKSTDPVDKPAPPDPLFVLRYEDVKVAMGSNS